MREKNKRQRQYVIARTRRSGKNGMKETHRMREREREKKKKRKKERDAWDGTAGE